MAAVGRADAAMAVLDAAAPAGASPIADRDLAGADKARNPLGQPPLPLGEGWDEGTARYLATGGKGCAVFHATVLSGKDPQWQP